MKAGLILIVLAVLFALGCNKNENCQRCMLFSTERTDTGTAVKYHVFTGDTEFCNYTQQEQIRQMFLSNHSGIDTLNVAKPTPTGPKRYYIIHSDKKLECYGF